MIRNVKDLSPEQRIAVESLLGRRVSEQEAVTVHAFEQHSVPEKRRQEIAEALRKYFAEVDANRGPVSAEEADEILNEAMRSTRPNYRPRR